MPKKVLAFGTFDVLHPGHEFFLEKASCLGDSLTVIVARDSNVKQIKGKPAVQNEHERLNSVKEVSFVNNALLGEEPLSYKIVEKQRPAVIALGYDQQADTGKLEKTGAEIVRIPAFKPSKFKSSILNTRKD